MLQLVAHTAPTPHLRAGGPAIHRDRGLSRSRSMGELEELDTAHNKDLQFPSGCHAYIRIV